MSTAFAPSRGHQLLFWGLLVTALTGFYLGRPGLDQIAPRFSESIFVAFVIAWSVALSDLVRRETSVSVMRDKLIYRSRIKTVECPMSHIAKVNVFATKYGSKVRVDFRDRYDSLKFDSRWSGYDAFMADLRAFTPDAFSSPVRDTSERA